MVMGKMLIQDPLRNTTATAISTESTTSNGLSSVFTNYPLMCALVAFAIAQLSKVITSRYKENNWDVKQLIGSGGMPSSHSSTVTALALAVGLQEGFGSSLFATALILSFVVMYDASGVRLHAGRQAEVLNQIVCGLPAEHPLAERGPLRELLGHTPLQVCAGAALGAVIATIGHLIRGTVVQAR